MNDFTEYPGSEERRAQFSLKRLLIWMAIIAVGAAIVGAVQQYGGIVIGLASIVYGILVLSVLAHVKYRWNDFYVNFATAMNVFCLGAYLFASFVERDMGLLC